MEPGQLESLIERSGKVRKELAKLEAEVAKHLPSFCQQQGMPQQPATKAKQPKNIHTDSVA
jgi:hypothetical protein